VGQFGLIQISGLDGLGATYNRVPITPRWLKSLLSG